MRAPFRRLLSLDFIALLLGTAALAAVGIYRERAGAAPPVRAFSTYETAPAGYGAWYEMLRRERVAVERFVRRSVFLDDRVGLLIWAQTSDANRTPSTRADRAALETWIKRGGTLLFLASAPGDAPGFDVHLPSYARAPRRRAHVVVAAGLRRQGVERLAPATTMRWRTRPGDTILYADAAGPLLVSYRYGSGTVVTGTDAALFSDARLARADDARLAYALANARGRGGVAFDEAVHGFMIPEHWWNVVPRRFAIALCFAAVFLLVAVGGAALRLGPPEIVGEPSGATSAEFVDALAALFERKGAAAKALRDAARSATIGMATALAVPGDVTPAEVARRLPSEALRSAFLEMTALSALANPGNRGLIRGVSLALQLRKEFDRHDRWSR